MLEMDNTDPSMEAFPPPYTHTHTTSLIQLVFFPRLLLPLQAEQGTKPALFGLSASNHGSLKGSALSCIVLRSCALICVRSLTEAPLVSEGKGSGCPRRSCTDGRRAAFNYKTFFFLSRPLLHCFTMFYSL